MKGTGSDQLGDYTHFFSGKPKSGRANRGVSILVKKKLQKSITDWQANDKDVGGDTGKLMLDNRQEIDNCDEYKYLGCIFIKEGTDDQEITSQITQARKAINSLNGVTQLVRIEIHYFRHNGEEHSALWKRNMEDHR
ncbi:hypothetical protein HHI36_001688 [Cryptolaemus montrouzieri]|uniref:Uncharacterized protein n=1 Tax=Cryptolaemus montrouzieri TaxID=559131 RepID=A0ABD2P947_9CUCU